MKDDNSIRGPLPPEMLQVMRETARNFFLQYCEQAKSNPRSTETQHLAAQWFSNLAVAETLLRSAFAEQTEAHR